MDETRTATEAEQRQVRLVALGVMLAALIVAAVLVALQAWTVAAAAAVIAAVAWWWAARLYSELNAQTMQIQAMSNARGRFQAPPPPPVADRFEG
jgi:membrane protein implicated in regulation of membrane protease activity